MDPDALFELFYNGGQRRTYTDVERLAKEGGIEVSYATIRRYADDFDWDARADELDAEARRVTDKRLADLIARHRVREVEGIATLSTKFFRRLVPSTAERPNPAEIRPEDIEIGDFLALVKTFELLTGGATERVGREGESTALQEMERAIAQMDARETKTIEAGGTT